MYIQNLIYLYISVIIPKNCVYHLYINLILFNHKIGITFTLLAILLNFFPEINITNSCKYHIIIRKMLGNQV